MSTYVGLCIRCRERKELPTGAMCSGCYAANNEHDDDYPPSDGVYHPKATTPEDPPRDDDSYGSEVTRG